MPYDNKPVTPLEVDWDDDAAKNSTPMPHNSVVIFTKAALMLAEADTIQKAKELKSLALTAKDWAERKGMGEAAIQHCRSYALEAERKMGEILAATERAKGGNPKLTPRSSREVEPSLKKLGVTWDESSRAQRLAALPRTTFDQIRNGDKSRSEVRREIKAAEVRKAVILPDAKFRVFYADPPWAYNDKCDGGAIQSGGAERHYPTMTIPELCALKVRDLAMPDAVLFLWVTSPLLFECAPIIEAWGFAYKASFVWDKMKHNMGHYNSVQHEFLLLCTRGSCLPDTKKLIDSVQSITRTTHSTKPIEFRTIIETLYPVGKRLELFARKQSDGWETFGNEC